MADALIKDAITVQQALHGYSEGHRLITGSVKLPTADARTMLALSDASATSSRLPTEGYLTGYPLPDSGKYVLARTWPAPEMSRPGCVWTHSLLIDFSDLARLGSAVDLLDYFVRPKNGSSAGFVSPVEVEVGREATPVTGTGVDRARPWIGALYERPNSKVIAEREEVTDDRLVLAIWVQQWPRLRRTFRFCTFSADDRSTKGDVFDLQLLDAGRSSRSKIGNAVLASEVEAGEWIDYLAEDLKAPGGSGLRRFLRDVGADVANGRAAMASFAQLFAALDPLSGAKRLSDAVWEMENLGSGQGRMGRAVAARAIFARSDLVDPQLFEFALDQVRADRDLLGIEPVVVGLALLRWEPGILMQAGDAGGPLDRALNAALPEVDVHQLVEILAAVPDATPRILPARPDVLEESAFWRIEPLDARQVLGSINPDYDRAAMIVAALVDAGRTDCAPIVVDFLGVAPIVSALSGKRPDEIHAYWPWLQSISRRVKELAECMVNGSLSQRPLLVALTAILDPDSIPNLVGEDPWITALKGTQPSSDQYGEDLLAAFLFNRARGWQSKSSGRLLSLSVQRLHEAMASGRLSEHAWRIAQVRLPLGSFWRDRDRCERLRLAVVDHFVDRELPPVEFATVVNDNKLWAKLVHLAGDTSLGRRYLERVRKALRHGSEPDWDIRARLIEDRLK